ncbi:MAG: EAL domain-containing protein [Oscillospiraceae bacterium]|nr:EAL domain-containing protein [Oscillospiraceae bacterium]
MSYFRMHQLEFLKIGGIICIVLFVFSLVLKNRTARITQALASLELGAGIMLLADYGSYIFNGVYTTQGYWGVRITNFAVFFLMNFEVFACNCYFISIARARDETAKNLKRAKAVYCTAAAGMAMVIVSQFNGMYYTFDNMNRYIRGPLFLLSYVFPLISLFLMISMIIQFRKIIGRGVQLSIVLSFVVPFTGAVYQNFNYGFDSINVSVGMVAMLIYAFSLIDQNRFLVKSASTDSMTGLPNQYGFIAETEKKSAQRELQKYCSVYFDIVRMGELNRRYGSVIGDRIITDYAAAVSEVTDRDEVLSRLGGNFFIALIKKEHIESFVDMLKGVPLEFKIGGETEAVSVAAVAGIFEIPDNQIPPDQIISNAAIAVNFAKNYKKVPYAYLTEELQNTIRENRSLESRIPAAIRNEEFVPYYQPKVNLDTMELCGAEALVRWTYDNVVVPPGSFIPLMEQNGTVCRLDFYILDKVCRDIVEWKSRGLTPPRISVNFSRKNLGNPVLAEEIYNVVKKYDISPDLIQIEITETIDEFPLSYLKGVVEALQRYGLTVAVDDFGTGSSSINLLREISFDVLKIDRQFIECHSEKEFRILGQIIGLGRTIESDIIAEGVEKTEQLEMLRQFGCSEIQGYIFDRPLVKKDFEERMERKKYTA